MNDSKYVRLYPEVAVVPLREVVEAVSKRLGWKSAADALKLHKAHGFPEDEPLFLLRGQDVLAPDIVRAYGDAVQIEDAFGGLDKNAAVIRHLHDFADRMERWRPRKLPD